MTNRLAALLQEDCERECEAQVWWLLPQNGWNYHGLVRTKKRVKKQYAQLICSTSG
jgi:hypothetical protein